MAIVTPKTNRAKLIGRSIGSLGNAKRKMRTLVRANLESNPTKARVAQVAEAVLLFAMGHRAISLDEEVNAFTDLIIKEMPR